MIGGDDSNNKSLIQRCMGTQKIEKVKTHAECRRDKFKMIHQNVISTRPGTLNLRISRNKDIIIVSKILISSNPLYLWKVIPTKCGKTTYL